ncbi:MAG: type II toxin-antitoxin system HicB family antitoxin [Acidobacteriaceae bacterium]
MQLTAVYKEIPVQEGGGYIAWIEEIPGANTQRGTLEETRANLREALRGVLEIKREIVAEQVKAHAIVTEPFEFSAKGR